MSDASSNNINKDASQQTNIKLFGTTTATTAKPRLSLSSKQSNIRIKSEDHSPVLLTQQQQQQQNILPKTTTTAEQTCQTLNTKESEIIEQNNTNFNKDFNKQQLIKEDLIMENNNEKETINTNVTPTTATTNQRLNTENITQTEESNRMNISKEDLIRLLSMLKSELQSKEIALAAIKCEQLKRLINPVEISRSTLANTYIELQDRIKICDQNNNNNNNSKNKSSATNSSISFSASKINHESNQRIKNNDTTSIEINDNNQIKENNYDDTDQETLNILNTLLELLDKHPLLALPRDSIYCLDYNCNELSTKNYLNLKINHLDNLIMQHRRFRYHMNERLKKSEQRYLDLTHQLELERLLKSEIEKSAYKTNGRAILLKHIDQLREALEKEKSDKQIIVMTLLNELLDERERSQELICKINELESITNLASVSNKKVAACEKEKLRSMEAEVNNLSMQLKNQIMVSKKEKCELESKINDLNLENSTLKSKLDHQEAKLANLIKGTSNICNNSKSLSNKESINSPSSPNSGCRIKETNVKTNQQNIPSNNNNNKQQQQQQQQQTSTPNVIARNNVAKSSPLTSKQQTSSNSASTNATSSTNPLTTQTTATATSSSSTNSIGTPKPPIVSRLIGGGSSSNNNNNSETQTIRVQTLFKSSSVTNSNVQQAKNLKTSSSSGGIGSTNNNSATTGTTLSSPPRGPQSSQYTTKPRIPAKPAQLLQDQQRNSLN